MLELFKAIAGGVVPTAEHSPAAQYAWRWRVALVSCAGLMLSIFWALSSYGMVPGIQGFAKSSDLASLIDEIHKNRDEVRTNRAATIDGQILDLRIKQCNAKSNEAKQLYWSKISPLLQEYQKLTGIQYSIPYCTDL